jgi:fucose permease
LGAFWFVPATQINTYAAFLAGLFLLATGLACLETIANPYTTVLGPPESGATRINMAQTCNGIGWVSGMLIGSMIILSSTQEVNVSNAKLYIPYLGIGIAVVIPLLCFIFAKVPDLHAAEDVQAEAEGKAIMFPTLFALSIRGLGEHTKLGSSILVMSIVGGAIMTPLMGLIADKCDMRIGFIVPMLCFAYIFVYGLLWKKLERRDAGGENSDEPVALRPVH